MTQENLVKLGLLLHLGLINVPLNAFINQIYKSSFQLVTFTPRIITEGFAKETNIIKYETIFY